VSTVPSKFLAWPLIAYLPVSALTVGLLATIMRLGLPPSGPDSFRDVFFAYALRFPGDFNIVRWVAPSLGLAVLILLSVAIRSARPIITLSPIRIFLLTLIVLLTILVKIFSVVGPFVPLGPGVEDSLATMASLTVYLFLFMDVDLCLVFLATFLPVYRGLRKRLV